MLPGLSTYAYTILSPSESSDEEGNPVRTETRLGAGRCHFEVLSTAARLRADAAGQSCDAALLTERLPAGTRPGDFVECRGQRWTVQAVSSLRAPVRVLVSEVTPR